MGETARLVQVMSPMWHNLIVQCCTCRKNDIVPASAGKKGNGSPYGGMGSLCRDWWTILFIYFVPKIWLASFLHPTGEDATFSLNTNLSLLWYISYFFFLHIVMSVCQGTIVGSCMCRTSIAFTCVSHAMPKLMQLSV